MLGRDESPLRKALQINRDDSIYGTFAEIGAGQEVARHFFQAGRASHTIAKTICAYDMTFSDEIYGKETRYVCEARLLQMLDHEYSLLQERLRQKRGQNTRFFAFADTVATASSSDRNQKSHGWLGIRFQYKPDGPYNDIILHVRLWDRFRLQQQEALGTLGVNLIHMAFFPPEEAHQRITALIDSLNTMRVEVNMIRFSGPDLQHLDNHLMSLELVKQGLTEAVLFGSKSEVLHAGDSLFRQPILVMRGTFRPVTNSNLDILRRTVDQFNRHPLLADAGAKVLLEITTSSLTGEAGKLDDEDFLHRVDTLSALGHEVMVSNFRLFYQLKSFLRQYTSQAIGLVVGAHILPRMFDPQFYTELPGGILEGMSRLFDDRTQVFVFPYKDDKHCATAGSFHPEAKQEHLFQYLRENQWIVDVANCDDVDTTVSSSDVRELMAKRDPKWKTLVPESASRLIEERQLFGYRP
ncbi:MAG: hypothetical protein AB7F86_12635 [Bdellovibrionales bacterium]